MGGVPRDRGVAGKVGDIPRRSFAQPQVSVVAGEGAYPLAVVAVKPFSNGILSAAAALQVPPRLNLPEDACLTLTRTGMRRLLRGWGLESGAPSEWAFGSSKSRDAGRGTRPVVCSSTPGTSAARMSRH